MTLPLMAHSRVSAFSTSPGLKRVGTHNGGFHCDEALGCFMIRLTDKFRDAQIIRTRHQQVLDGLDAVLDVGGVYDPSRDRYDHHQKGFGEVFGHGLSTKLSSAGLVYKHFGMEIIARELQLDQGHPDVPRLFLAVYKSFMEAVDAVDNGINQYDTEDQPPRYVNNTHLSSRVGKLNLDWMDPDQSAEKENEAFERAMNLTCSEFLDNVRFHAKSWLPARSIVMECLALHLFELEEEMKIDPPIKYVLYQDDRSNICSEAASGDRGNRRSTPPEWAHPCMFPICMATLACNLWATCHSSISSTLILKIISRRPIFK
ncbi:hypothetical protein PVL29_022429 [Vitis rotundifolia]|uniref:Metal-dependent protein hydrolase n=1 Tax=Vitis rotundifolia TaxID=103349 RepID=A0AA38YVK6_VITRO|nr:hypothetical protein PVL29_022429 [Vitis rotundifolia]